MASVGARVFKCWCETICVLPVNSDSRARLKFSLARLKNPIPTQTLKRFFSTLDANFEAQTEELEAVVESYL